MDLGCYRWLVIIYLYSSNFQNVYPVNAEVLLKATNVDGVYDDDPKQNTNARLLETLTYQEVTSKDLSVMDMTAITLCQENNIPGMYCISLYTIDHCSSK